MAGLACAAVLGASAQEAQQVVVSATRFAQPRAELPFGVSVLTADDLRSAGATTVNEAVMKLLGVPGRLDFYGGGDYQLDLRGFGATADANQVVILDGVRLNEGDLGGTRLAGIPIDTVERIEVLRGNAAVLYGEGATGGAIVITTRAHAAGTRPRSSVYGGVGSLGLRELRASGACGQGPWSFDVAGHRRAADNHRDNFHADTGSASAGARWQDGGLRLGARTAYDALETGLPGSLSAAQYAANPRQTNTPNDRATIRNLLSTAFAQADVGGWQLAGDLGWRQKALRSLNSGFPFDYDVRASQQSLRARRDLQAAGVLHGLVVGADREHWQRDVLGSFGSTAEQRSLGAYVRDDMRLPTGTRLALGWRRQLLDKQGSGLQLNNGLDAWDVGLTQPIGAAWAVYGRTGRSFRTGNADEVGFTSGNAVLRPQRSRDHELGVRWAQDGARAELRLYRSELRDEIGYDPNGAPPLGSVSPGANVNFDPTRRQGVELEAEQRLNAQWRVTLVAAAREATFRAGPYAGRDVPLAPRTSVSLRTDWQPAAGHRVDAVLRYVGTQHPDFANQCTMPSYTTADLRYARQWGSLEAAIAIANLTDRRYYTQAFRCDAVSGSPTRIYPEAGRTASASLRWWF